MGDTKTEKIYVVAIDGPAGAGKSTIAKKLARILKFAYLDTGAMYRALTLKAIRNSIDLENEDQLVSLARQTVIDVTNKEEFVLVMLDGEDVSEEIRTIEVTNKTFYIARAPRIREIMVNWQKEIGLKKSIVVEGRDVTTVVFPDADFKFYMDADIDVRSKRRFIELQEKGKEVELKRLTDELKERDNKDHSRKIGALKIADDAVVIDTTFLSIDEVVEEILKYVKKIIN